MEMMLTGHTYSAADAVSVGFANRAYPAEELDDRVLGIANDVARVASDLQQINKRSVHRSFDVWGGRAAMRAGQEFQALAGHQASVQQAKLDPLAAMKKAFDR